MAKNEISDYDETDSGNTDISGIVLSDATLIDALDNIARAQMGALKRWFKSSLFRLRDSTDQTKLLAFDLSGLTTATTRTLTVPDANMTLVGTGTTQTLTNKTMTAPKVNGPGVGVGTSLVSFRDSADTELGYVGAASGTNAHFAIVSSSANVNITSLSAAGVINLGGTTPADTATAGVSVYKAGSAGGHTLYAINANNGNAMVIGTVSSADGSIVTFTKGASSCGSISATTTTTAYNTSSDERLKDFHGLYDPAEAISIIRADPVRTFSWISELGGGDAVGWGAQTSYQVSPDLASPGRAEPGEKDFQPWGVDHGKRTPYLWAALTYALDKIEEQDALIASLHKRLTAAGL